MMSSTASWRGRSCGSGCTGTGGFVRRGMQTPPANPLLVGQIAHHPAIVGIGALLGQELAGTRRHAGRALGDLPLVALDLLTGRHVGARCGLRRADMSDRFLGDAGGVRDAHAVLRLELLPAGRVRRRLPRLLLLVLLAANLDAP